MMSEVKIDIPAQLIENTIMAELVKNVSGENKDRLMKAVVEKAMSGKKDDYRSSRTFFQEAVEDMIRDEAKEIFRTWIDQNRKAIADALMTYMNEKKQVRLKEFCEKMANSINRYGINISLNLSDKE